MRIFKHSQTMGIAAAIMAGSILLSRFMGLIRDKVISYYYGAALESDIYFTSFVIPDFINYLLAGGYFSITLIPLLSEYFGRDEQDGWRFFGAVFTWMGLSIVLLTGLAMIFAPQLAGLAAPGFSPEATARLARFLRIILPAQVFFLSGSCLTAILYIRKQFLVPALTPLMYNGLIILCGLVMIDRGMEGFCWGVLIGSFLGNFLLPLLAARRGGGIKLRFHLIHPGLKKFAFLALPLMLGQSVVVLDEQLIRIFGSMAGEGAVSWLNYARRIMLVPVGVVAQAAGVASYPFLAGLAAKRDRSGFNQSLGTALNNTLVFILPLSAWMITVSGPTIRVIFEQGRFGPADTQAASLCLKIMLVVVFCWGVQQILGRAFYAGKDTLTPSLTGTGASLVSIPLYYLLTKKMGAPGAAVASSFSVALYTLALTLIWRLRHGPAALAGVGKTLLSASLLSLAASGAAYPCLAIQTLFPNSPLTGALAALAASGLAFSIAFLALGKLLAPTLITRLLPRRR